MKADSNIPFVGLHAHSGVGSLFDGLGYPQEHMDFAHESSTGRNQGDEDFFFKFLEIFP